MTLEEAKVLAQKKIKMTHKYFTPDEWMVMSGNQITFEDGNKTMFDEWVSNKPYLLDNWDYFNESDKLNSLSQQEDNDFKAFSLMCKALREKRSEKFIEDWLPVFKSIYPIEERGNGSYSFTTINYGIIDYFPKANKVLIRKDNTWEKPGLRWLIKHLAK